MEQEQSTVLIESSTTISAGEIVAATSATAVIESKQNVDSGTSVTTSDNSVMQRLPDNSEIGSVEASSLDTSQEGDDNFEDWHLRGRTNKPTVAKPPPPPPRPRRSPGFETQDDNAGEEL